MAAYPKITTYPPLGQLSIIPFNQEAVRLNLVIEWSIVRPAYLFDIAFCYAPFNSSEHASLWSNILLKRSSQNLLKLLDLDDQRRAVYSATLPGPKTIGFNHIRFAVKYRTFAQGAWQWLTVAGNFEYGELLCQLPPNNSATMESQINLADGWGVKRLDNRVDGAALYELESSHMIPKATEEASLQTSVLGYVKGLERYFGLSRIEPPWLGPRHGRSFFYLAEDSVLVCCTTETGLYITVVASPSIDSVYTVLRSDEKGRVVVASRNYGHTDAPFRIYVATSTTLESGISAAMSAARDFANMSPNSAKILDAVAKMKNLPPAEPWLDGLTFCTYNALGTSLTSDDILNALEQFHSSGIGLSALLIDETYQTLGLTGNEKIKGTLRGAASFQADPEKFPGGLKSLLDTIKERYSVQDIGVWGTLFGHWGALAASGQIQDEYRTTKIRVNWGAQWDINVQIIDETDVDRYFDDYYKYLQSCGVTFVKTDGQNLVNDIVLDSDRERVIPPYRSAWAMAHRKYFGSKAISCMSMVPEMLAMQFQTKLPPIVLRNSDDFFPEIPNSHTLHIWANAHNALFTRHLNVVPDWDMFQTDHAYSALHGAARCLSGGPVYITDTPGKHDIALIQQITGSSPDTKGRSIVLRPAVLSRTIDAFNGYGESPVLKIGSETSTGVKLLGLFNMTAAPASLLVPVSDFLATGGEATPHSLEEITEMVIRSHQTSQIIRSKQWSAEDRKAGPGIHSLIQTVLPEKGFDIWSAYPTTQLEHPPVGSLSIAVLGLLGKMSGAAAVKESNIGLTPDGDITVRVKLKALGVLGIWLSSRDVIAEQNISISLYEGSVIAQKHWKFVDVDGANGCVSDPEGVVLEIDTLQAWDQLGLWHQGHKEVEVNVIFR